MQHLTSSSRERCSAPLRLFGAHEGSSRALQCSCEHVRSTRGYLEIAAVLLLGCSEITWDLAYEAVWSSRAVLESAAVLLSGCSELTRGLREHCSAHVNTFRAHEDF